MPKPIILQVGPYPDWDQVPLDAAFDAKQLFDVENPQAVIDRFGADVRGIATRGELGADASMINACPNLEIISVYGVGYDAVDIALCKEKGIRVTNTPDVLTGDVARSEEHTSELQSRPHISYAVFCLKKKKTKQKQNKNIQTKTKQNYKLIKPQ